MTPTLSTSALVLHTTAYSETSVIAKIFTRQLGVRSYIIKGVRRGGSRTKQNLLQPLSHLDMVVYNNPKTSLNYIKEMAPHLSNTEEAPVAGSPVPDVSRQMTYNALRFFMTELLYKTLREEEPLPALFDYVATTLHTFDHDEAGEVACGHLPILFLLNVLHHLGIGPLDNYSSREPLFDLKEGRFCFASDMAVSADTSSLLHHYLQALHDHTPLPLSTLERRTQLINCLLQYCQQHLSEFRNFKSHEILHTVLQ